MEILNYPNCEGELKDVSFPQPITDYRITGYVNSIGHSSVELTWVLSVTTESVLGESTGTTTITINDEGVNTRLEGKSGF